MRWFALAALASLLLAGCASGPSPPAATTSGTIQYDDGGANKVDIPLLPRDPPAPGERTLAAVPELRLGEWWEYNVTDHFTGNQFPIRRIVAGSFGPHYLIGFPVDAFSNDALVLHIPGYGDVDRADLSFEVHDADFQPLSFPVEAGATWPTAWEGRPGHATVLAVNGTQATVQVTDGQSYNWTLTYDAEAGDIVRISDPHYATVELTGHGFHYEGAVRVPHAHDLVFLNGRFGPWGIGSGPTQNPFPAASNETVVVEPGYDRLAFVIAVGGGPNALFDDLPTLPGAGSYRERVTAPDGTVYELAMGPTEPGGLKIQFFGAEQPAGTWLLEHEAHGPGIVLTEGIGYHSIDIDLPSGCVLPGPNANHHVNPCTGRSGA